MNKFITIMGAFVVGFAIVAFVSFLFAFPTMWLLNYVLSDTALMTVFGGQVGVWKALCVNLLSGLLIKSSITNDTKGK